MASSCRSPADPLGMSSCRVVLEAKDLLLLIVHKPPLACSLGGIVVFVAGAFLEHDDKLRRRPFRRGVEIVVTGFMTVGTKLMA